MKENLNSSIKMDTNQLYMTFEAGASYRNDIMQSIFSYAKDVCDRGYDYFEKNLIRCHKASNSSVQWYYDNAKQGDKYWSFCCSSPKTGLKINVFVNSRKADGYNSAEVYFVRLALASDNVSAKKGCFGRMGSLRNGSQVRDYEDQWVKVAMESDSLSLVQTA